MDRLAIVGLGLIGGSLGMAVRSRRPEIEVVGVTRRETTATKAVERGAAHRASTALADIADADVVVLACPLGVQREVLEACVPHLREGARVTDVGSVKGAVVEHAGRALDARRNPFLGGHPMAGKEVGGIDVAEPGLFEGAVWAFTPAGEGGDWPGDFADLVDLVGDIGARPLRLSPAAHDRYVALISHVPFLVSAALLDAAAANPGWAEAKHLASSGFRDTTRLGGGDPDMYTAIVAQNRDAVLDGIAELHAALERIDAAVSRDEPGFLHDLLATARDTRRDWLEATARHSS